MKMTSTCEIKEDIIVTLKNFKYDSRSPLPLQRIAQMNITVLLWKANIDQGINFQSTFHLQSRCVSLWQYIENIILEKLCLFPLPKIMKKDLQTTVCAFGEELEFFFSALLSKEQPFVAYFVTDYWRYLCWTRLGKIDTVNTMKEIIDHSSRTIEQKYVYACNFFLTEKIEELYHNLLPELQEEFGNLCEKNIEEMPLVVIWTLSIKDKNRSFSEIAKQVHPDLLRWAISSRNMVAVQYIVEQNAYDGDHLHICFTLLNNYSDDKFCDGTFLYFLRHLTPVQLEEIFLKMGIYLLPMLKSSSKCHNLFLPVAKYILKHIKKMDAYIALRILLICWRENAVEYDEYQMLWRELTAHVSFNMWEGEMLFYRCLRESLINDTDIKTWKLLISFCSPERKTELLYNDPGMELCTCLIKKKKLDLLDMVISDMIPQENIVHFKKELFKEEAYTICKYFIVEDQYETLEEVLQVLHFEGNFEEVFSRERILLTLKDILKITEITGVKPLVGVDKFLKWCFKGDEEVVIKFKADVFNIDDIDAVGFIDKQSAVNLLADIFSVERLLIGHDDFQWELAEKYWKWIYDAAPKTDDHKKKMLRMKKILRYSCGNFFKSVTLCISACLESEEFEELIEVVGDIEELLKYFY